MKIKKLQESVIDEIIGQSLDLMKDLEELDLPGISYNDLIDSVDLETSEDDLDNNGEVIEKSSKYKKAEYILKQLNEAIEKSRKVSKKLTEAINPTVVQFLKSNPMTTSYKTYVNYCNDNGLQPISNTAYFNARAKYQEGEGSVGDYSTTIKSKKPVELSDSLQKLVDMCSTGSNYVETAIDTVESKYKIIELKLKRVIQNKSLKNYYLLLGDAGIGKSFIVKDCLRKCGIDPKSIPIITGDIGSSRTDTVKFLWKYKDADLVVLDDCDTLLSVNNPAVQNMLKGAMDPDSHTVTISPSIHKALVKSLKEDVQKGKNDHLFEEVNIEGVDFDIKKALKSKGVPTDVIDKYDFTSAIRDGADVYFDKDIDSLNIKEVKSLIELIVDNEIDNNEDIQKYLTDDSSDLDIDVPMTWEFNARVVFVSNLDEKDVDKAILSRCDYYSLHLTQEEYMVRLGLIIKDLSIDSEKSGWSLERIQRAKAFAVSIMGSVIEAANKDVQLFGKAIRLTHPLEFRLVKDLISGILMLEDDYISDHPEASQEEIDAAVLPDFIKIILLPRL